jgi:2,3-bisphosphoglycerate-independent phosphoglycerate mutase
MREALVGQDADIVLFRGFDTRHELPSMQDRFGLRPATVATYPMYRGVAKLVGMDQLPVVGSLGEQIALMAAHWDDYDYLFAHEKAADSAGHDGDRDAKIAAIEAVDASCPTSSPYPTCCASPATTRRRRSSRRTPGIRSRCCCGARRSVGTR